MSKSSRINSIRSQKLVVIIQCIRDHIQRGSNYARFHLPPQKACNRWKNSSRLERPPNVYESPLSRVSSMAEPCHDKRLRDLHCSKSFSIYTITERKILVTLRNLAMELRLIMIGSLCTTLEILLT